MPPAEVFWENRNLYARCIFIAFPELFRFSLGMSLFVSPDPEQPLVGHVVERVRAVAKRAPNHEAVVCGAERLTWAEFDLRINKVANLLIGLGVGHGDRVAILDKNSLPFAEVFMGALRAGACITPLSTMAAGEALHKMIVDSGAKVLLVSEAMRPLVDEFAVDLDGLVPGGLIALDFAAEGWGAYEPLVAQSSIDDPMIPLTFNDRFDIIYSSGTTGTPKGILHDHKMRAVQMARIELSGYTNKTRTLLSTPLYSNTTIVAFLPTLVAGGTVVLMPKFDAREYVQIAEAERITHTMLVPVQYQRIMALPDLGRFDLSSMETKFSTSAPLRADLKRDVLARFPGGLIEYYGLTEGGGTCILPAHEHPDKLHTVGTPAPDVEIRLIDEEGREVPLGSVGEICGRSPAMMVGYFGREDLTEATLWRSPEGDVFFRTGDMGHFDEDGFLMLSDRIKDMIISGGLNIFANDLELMLLDDPDVDDAAVIGMPSEDWGETPLGVVVLAKGAARGVEQIKAAANARLGKSHRLAGVVAREDMPRSSIGKILKRELRDYYAKDWIA